jgi:hypothetical protein
MIVETSILESQGDTSLFEFPVSDKDNMVADVFSINLEEQILELSNEFCKYYNALSTEDDSKYFAIIYEDGFSPPLKIIDFLSKNHITGLNRIVAYSIVNIAPEDSQKLVVIVDSYDFTNTLSATIQNQGIFSQNQLEEMLRSMIEIIDNLSKAGIYGYNIKPSNVIIKDSKFYVLKSFIDSYPFFYQEDHFLAPELLECHIAGRASHTTGPDIYSLGVTAYFAFTGKELWAGYKNSLEYNEARLEQTTYKYLLARLKMPERFRLLFKQLLHDNPSVRWKIFNIKDWLESKEEKIHEFIIDNKNTLGFNDRNYSNAKSISYALYNNWEKAIKFIKDNKLYKWAKRLEISEDRLNGIKSIVDNKSISAGFADKMKINSNVSKLLSILDPHGPIRIEGIAFAPKSVPSLLHYLVFNNKRIAAESVIKAIKEEYWKDYDLMDSIGYLDEKSELGYKLSSISVHSGSTVKSIERLVYSLNPDAKCLSKLFRKRYVTNISDLLSELDILAAQDPKKFVIDRHLVAFVAAILDLKEDISPVILPNFPKFVEHQAIKILSIINILHQYEPEIKIPNIFNSIILSLKDLFKENLYNVDFKNEMINSLDEVGKDGDLSKIILFLSNQQKFINDYNGYYESCRQVKNLEDKINILTSGDNAYAGALLLGQKMTVLTSYILCFIVTITVIM